MWTLAVECIASAGVCLLLAWPPAPIVFPTKAACNKVALETAMRWDAGRGAFSFRCIPPKH